MDAQKGIVFEEANLGPEDFLNRLTEPGQIKRKVLPPGSAQAIHRRQLARLQKNIEVLRKKQKEFNQKIEEYVGSLESLILNFNRSMVHESPPGEGSLPGGTRVRCINCGREKVFEKMLVLLARDSTESITQPTALIVDDGGEIKKGTFRCPTCGNYQFQIQDL